MQASDVAENVDRLVERLSAELGVDLDAPTVESLGGGNANETILLRWDDFEVILRGAPAFEPAPEILHGLEREYHVLEVLAPTPVPTPEPVWYCDDPAVLGEPFYVMERRPGAVIDVAVPPGLDEPAYHEQLTWEIVDTLAAIHAVDPGSTDIEPVPLRDRLEQFRNQLTWAQERTSAVRPVPRLESVGEWLVEHVPEGDDRTLLHGDYKPDNLLFASEPPPRVSAVLDWELVTIGDPRLDVGWLLSYWEDADDPSPLDDDLRERYEDHAYFPLLEVFVDDYATFMRAPSFPDRIDIVERYEAATGRQYRHDRFHRTFGVFKLAALCEGFFRLYLERPELAKGTHPAMELLVPTLARQAEQIIEDERPL